MIDLSRFKKLKVAVKCQLCENETYMPFRCRFCDGIFCVEHRLPENHACPEYWKARIPRREISPPVSQPRREHTPFRRVTPLVARSRPNAFWFSLTELKHLAFGTLLVMGVGISLFWFTHLPQRWIGLSLLFTSGFLLHEVSHKLVAQFYGLWAEFRLTFTGTLLTLLSIVTPIKIISPGAVLVVGSGSLTTHGKISLAGPLTNLVLSLLFFIFERTSPIFVVGCFYNAFIALINLIPFGGLDGMKVFRWDKRIWAVAFALSTILSVWTFTRIY